MTIKFEARCKRRKSWPLNHLVNLQNELWCKNTKIKICRIKKRIRNLQNKNRNQMNSDAENENQNPQTKWKKPKRKKQTSNLQTFSSRKQKTKHSNLNEPRCVKLNPHLKIKPKLPLRKSNPKPHPIHHLPLWKSNENHRYHHDPPTSSPKIKPKTSSENQTQIWNTNC